MVTFQKRAELRGKQRHSAGKRPQRPLHPFIEPAGILRRRLGGKRRFGDASEMKNERGVLFLLSGVSVIRERGLSDGLEDVGGACEERGDVPREE